MQKCEIRISANLKGVGVCEEFRFIKGGPLYETQDGAKKAGCVENLPYIQSFLRIAEPYLG